MSTPLTTEVARELAPELLRSAVDRKITKVRPMATPIDQISRMAGATRTDAMEVAYYTVGQKASTTTTAEALNLTYRDPKDEVGKVAKLKVTDPSIFSVSDTVLFPDYKLNDSSESYLTGYISEIDGDSLTITFENTATANLTKGSAIVRMGRAASELDVQTAQYVVVPERRTNYCQLFKMQVEQSTLMRMANKEVSWSFSEQEEAAVIDMRFGMEKNFLFGTKGRFLDATKGEYIYLTGGIWSQAGRTLNLDLSTGDPDKFITLCRQIFTGNNGSKKRLLVGGTNFVEAVSKMRVSEKVVQGPFQTRWGLETREIATNFGSLYIIHSEVFDMCGHADDALVLDQAFISKYTHIPFQPSRLDLRSSGSRNTEAVVLTEASCLVLRNPEAHARVKLTAVE